MNSERDRDVHATVQALLKQLVPHLQSGNERQALQAIAVSLGTRFLPSLLSVNNIINCSSDSRGTCSPMRSTGSTRSRQISISK